MRDADELNRPVKYHQEAIAVQEPMAAATAAAVPVAAVEREFVRFNRLHRTLHACMIISFLSLAISGLSLKFSYTKWAVVLSHLLGGFQTAGYVHRFAAVIMFGTFITHLVDLYRTKTKKHLSWRTLLFGPDTLVPTGRDFHDFIATMKWFLHLGPRPQYGRWTYWEKFDYFAVFWGVAIIGASGLIMWYPAFFTRFLPGWLINIALVIHSDEALLAAGFIFSIHFFNTHFRIEKFPMDTVIFSGRVSKNEMLHERRRWYDRLVAEGRLDEYRVRDEWLRWRSIARSFGYFFFGLGVILLILIIYAMVTRIFH